MIYVECTPDTIMARTLSAGDAVEHLSGKSRVCHKLMDANKCKGMVDQDESSQKHPYIRELHDKGYLSYHDNHELIIYTDKDRDNRLILICPRLEEWIIKTAHLAHVNMSRYQLPDVAEELHLLLSIGEKRKLDRFRMLIQKLVGRSGRIDALASFLK